jgi:hypothetical protein
MIREESLSDKSPNKIAHIGFLEIKYSSPLRVRELDLFSFMGYFLT